jgi:hypothetical protein
VNETVRQPSPGVTMPCFLSLIADLNARRAVMARPGELEHVARNLEVDVGRGDNARALLETDLV